MSSDNLTKCRAGLNLLRILIGIGKKCPFRMFTDCNNYNEERRERELITAVVIRVSPSREEREEHRKNVPGRNYGNYRDTKMSDRDL